MAFSNSFPSILSTSESEMDHLTSTVTASATATVTTANSTKSQSPGKAHRTQSPASSVQVGSRNKWASVPTLTSDSETPEHLSLRLRDQIQVDIDYNSQYGSSGSGFDANDTHLPLDDTEPEQEPQLESDHLFRFCSVNKHIVNDNDNEGKFKTEQDRQDQQHEASHKECQLQDLDFDSIIDSDDQQLVVVLDPEDLNIVPHIETQRSSTKPDAITSDMEIQDNTRETFQLSTQNLPPNPTGREGIAGTIGMTALDFTFETGVPVHCDLLSQLTLGESNRNDVQVGGPREPSLVDIDSCPSTTEGGQSQSEKSTSTVDQDENPIEPDMMSSFDDNGNPWNLDGDPPNPLKLPLLPDKQAYYAEQQQHQQQIQPHLVHETENNSEVVKDGNQELILMHGDELHVEAIKSCESETCCGNKQKQSSMSNSNSNEKGNEKERVDLTDTSECTTIKLGFKVLQKSVEGFMDEPKYFINAAALSDDLEAFTMPSLESDTGLDELDMSNMNSNCVSSTNGNANSNGNTNTTATPLALAATMGDGKGKGDKSDAGNPVSRGPSRHSQPQSQPPLSSTQLDLVVKEDLNELSRDKSAPLQPPLPSHPPPTVVVKPRVPMSKSFPDIIQTTFVDDRCEFKSKKLIKAETLMEKDPSYNDLAADSLEELPLTDQLASKDFQYPQKHSHQNSSETYSNVPYDFKGDTQLEDIMELSQSQSQIGILAEKPPEAWVIDFSSLSLESEAFDSHSEMSSSIKSSNPNSLAFFIDMEDNSAAEQQAKNKHTTNKSPDKKKIFSMFVDFGENEKPQQPTQASQVHQHISSHPHPHPNQASVKPSRLPVHRNVMNVLKDEDSSIPSVGPYNPGTGSKGIPAPVSHGGQLGSTNKKRTFQYPSPILQHKVAAEAARKAAASKIELLEATEKSKEACEDVPREAMTTGSASSNANTNIETSTTSNRSSLHVATDFDMMTFSSSFISSMETSAPNAEEVCSKGPCFKLGKDLLRMFQDGINTDVNICVNGRYLKAHKCILSSRSQYFAAIFSGQLIEKAGNTITLDGFSYNVVHFTMCHIYSGTNEIPDSIDLLELATLTDLLGLEGLRENISQTIRVKFCHNFHRPCTGCIAGVLECFHIALSYEMDELHRKMTKWICKHFVRIWPTKAFANLGDDMIEKCLRYSVNHLSVDNILDITLGCDQLLTTMPSVRWTEPVFAIVNQLTEACVQFIGEHFSQVLQCQRFLLFGKGQQWNISRIEGTFTESMALIKPDEACLSHTALSRLIELGTETIDEVEWSTMFVDFLKMLCKEIERYLIANASKAVLSKYWEHLGQDVRKRICTTSFLAYDKAGNKIVKGNASSVGSKQQNPGRLTPSERTSSISSNKSGASSNKSSGRHHAEHNKSSSPSFGQGNYSSKSNVPTAKIASVRPIQNVFSTAVEAAEVVEAPTPTKPVSGSGNHSTSSSKPGSGSHRAQPTQLNRRKGEEKEKSFSNSPRNSVASSSLASANRTPLNPLTPITPSKPGPPGIGSAISTATTTRVKRATTPGVGSGTRNSSTNSSTATSTTGSKSAFVTNSARANAVSKPVLRQKNVASTANKSSSNTPRTPNLTQPSRYASSLGVASHNRNARGSFSGSEKSEKITATSAGSNEVKGTRGRVSSMSSTSSSSAGVHSRVRSNREKSNAKNSSGGSGNTSASNSSSRQASAKSSSGFGTGIGAGDSMRDSMNVMSRSTIDTDSGETKMRTLAEIGRSSTFSKDEPTILGKLDPGYAMSIDFS